MQGSQKQFAFALPVCFFMGVAVHVFSFNGPAVDSGCEWIVVAPSLRARNTVHLVVQIVGGQKCNTTLCCSFAGPLLWPSGGFAFGSVSEWCPVLKARRGRWKTGLSGSTVPRHRGGVIVSFCSCTRNAAFVASVIALHWHAQGRFQPLLAVWFIAACVRAHGQVRACTCACGCGASC